MQLQVDYIFINFIKIMDDILLILILNILIIDLMEYLDLLLNFV